MPEILSNQPPPAQMDLIQSVSLPGALGEPSYVMMPNAFSAAPEMVVNLISKVDGLPRLYSAPNSVKI